MDTPLNIKSLFQHHTEIGFCDAIDDTDGTDDTV